MILLAGTVLLLVVTLIGVSIAEAEERRQYRSRGVYRSIVRRQERGGR